MEISNHEIRIVRAGPERIVELEPLWKALLMHYQDIGWCLPCTPVEQSWDIACVRHKGWLSETGSFMLFAEYRDKPVGYTITCIEEKSPMVFQFPDKVASLRFLSVLPEARNMGIGTALIDAVYEELRLSNIATLTLDVLCTNIDALRFYERHGLIPGLISMYQSIPQKQEARQ